MLKSYLQVWPSSRVQLPFASNVSAHEGDALGDAVMFSKDPSISPRIYSELYGLTHEQVLNFSRSYLQVFNDAEADRIQMNIHPPTMDESILCSMRMLQLLLKERSCPTDSESFFTGSWTNSSRIGCNCRTKTLTPHLGWHISVSGDL